VGFTEKKTSKKRSTVGTGAIRTIKKDVPGNSGVRGQRREVDETAKQLKTELENKMG